MSGLVFSCQRLLLHSLNLQLRATVSDACPCSRLAGNRSVEAVGWPGQPLEPCVGVRCFFGVG